MTTINLREPAEQALKAMRCAVPTGTITLYEWDKAISDLAAALAQQAEPVQEPGFWGRVAARQASRIKQLEATAQQALEFIRAMNEHGWLLADYESDMERTVAGLEAALAQEQAEPVCKCDLRTRLVGDGCEVCNPGLAAELAQQAEPTTGMAEITRLRAERDALAQRLREVCTLLADTSYRHRKRLVMAARESLRACPDCHGIGYDASGQLCGCQDNPSFG